MPTIDLLNEDCMAVMARYPDKYFDLACVDPPYGIEKEITQGTAKFAKLYTNNGKKWDIKPEKIYFEEIRRVSSNQIICGGNYFADMLPASRGWAIYDKVIDGFTSCKPELIYTSFHVGCKIFRRNQAFNNGFMNKEGAHIHPTQKPIQLYEWLLHNYAKPGQRILDTHLGSGSSAIAAHYFGVDFVGCELDEDYFKAAKARFERQTRQTEMFGYEPAICSQSENFNNK
ncbi:MAG: hypothetical protein LLF94_08215 [Chlamydiales bacterium]|nr:hypothetical protein [Chlamydiales bacterium]